MTDFVERQPTVECSSSHEQIGRRSNRGVNTFGEKIISHIDAINEAYNKSMKQAGDVRSYLADKTQTEWGNKKFAYITLRQYCRGPKMGMLVPAEFGIAVFSAEDGIIEVHTGFVEVDEIPFAESGEVKLTCEINGYPHPKFDCGELLKPKPIDPTKFIRMINALVNKYGLVMNDENVFFSARSEISIITCCFNWIRSKSTVAQSKAKIRLIPFEILLKEITMLAEAGTAGVIETEGAAGKIIYHPRYDFCQILGCEWHKKGLAAEKIDRCASNISMRRVYNCLYYLCHLFQKELKPGSHCPRDEIAFLKMPDVAYAKSETESRGQSTSVSTDLLISE